MSEEYIADEIDGVIRTVDSAEKVYKSRKDAASLPKAFHEVAKELALVTIILAQAAQQIKSGSPTEEACTALELVVKSCESKATQLEKLFRRCIPEGKASTQDRYVKAVQFLGRDHMVEVLMKGLLEAVQQLASNEGVKLARTEHTEQLVGAIERMSKMDPSVPAELQGKPPGANIHYGSGPQINHGGLGDQNTNTGAGKMFVGQQQTFNEVGQK
jgi:hypothetical protein